MIKKITATVLLILFMGINFSCSYYDVKQVCLEEGKPWKGKETRVFTVYTKSRQLIEFLKKTPAVVEGGNITGFTEDETGKKILISIPVSEVEVMWIKKADVGSTLLSVLSGVGVFWILFIAAHWGSLTEDI